MMLSIFWILFVLVALCAAASDLTSFRIPNLIPAGLLLLFLGDAVLHSGHIPWIDHLAAGGLSLVVALLFYGLGKMGAGDAKLLAVVALWAGLSGLVPLLFAIALCGLVFLLLVLAARRMVVPWLMERYDLSQSSLPRVLARRAGIPYGVGIVLGAIISSWAYPHWLWQV